MSSLENIPLIDVPEWVLPFKDGCDYNPKSFSSDPSFNKPFPPSSCDQEKPKKRRSPQQSHSGRPRVFQLFNKFFFRIGVPFQRGLRSKWKLTCLTDFCMQHITDPEKTHRPALNAWSTRTELQIAVVDFDDEELIEAEGFTLESLEQHLRTNFPNSVISVTQSSKPKMFLLFDFGDKGRKLNYKIVQKVLQSYLPASIYKLIDDSPTALQIAYLNPQMVRDLYIGLPLLRPILTWYSNPYVLRPWLTESNLSLTFSNESLIRRVNNLGEGNISTLFCRSTNNHNLDRKVKVKNQYNISNTNYNKKEKTLEYIYSGQEPSKHHLKEYRGPLPEWVHSKFNIKSKPEEMFLRCLINVRALETGWRLSSDMLSRTCKCDPRSIRRYREKYEEHGLTCIDRRYRFGANARQPDRHNYGQKFKIGGALLELRRELFKKPRRAGSRYIPPVSITDGAWHKSLFRTASVLSTALDYGQTPEETKKRFWDWFDGLPGCNLKQRRTQARHAIERAIKLHTERANRQSLLHNNAA